MLLAIPLAAILGVWLLDPSPDFRLACTRAAADPRGLTLAVAKAAHLEAGTTFTISYGDGTADGSLGQSRARLTHTYRAHGDYEITAQVHLPSNEVDSYRNSCRV